MKFVTLVQSVAVCAHVAYAASIRVSNSLTSRQESDGLQDLVTWDEHSLFIRGERLFIFSGEFHPFRLPVPGLWLDVFQKIKAMGFNGVSFYTDWGLLEGNPGHVVTDGIWGLDDFFKAATEAGIYLIARPGPYINAEVSAGGFPGWLLRTNCTLRTTCPEYLDATQNYLTTLLAMVEAAQVTKGGPVILAQPENEYTTFPSVPAAQFPEQPQKEYMAAVEQQFRNASITVPLIDNDNLVNGDFAPGTGVGAIDIYGIDAYPLRYDCAHPSVWPTIRWPQNWQILHEQQSPTTPFAIAEFQGGSGTSFQGVNQDMCNALVNEEAARVVYKNNYSFGVKLFNIYMTYGGTNWGNLGYQGGDSSYDYGAAITEDRHVWREKYSEQKLEANFFKVSPAYLTATPGNASNGSFVSTNDIAVTPLFGNGSATNFYVVRHADWISFDNTTFTITVPTSAGNFTIPQLGGELGLYGRDSKIFVTDYQVGDIRLVYSTAEVFTWAKSSAGKTVLILYGGAGETHEFALPASCNLSMSSSVVDDKTFKESTNGTTLVVQWQVRPEQQYLSFNDGNIEVYLLWRNDAYNYWVLELPGPEPVGNFSSPSKSSVIVKAGYLMRTASIADRTLRLTGDVNATTDIDLVFETTGSVTSMSFNGALLNASSSQTFNSTYKLSGTVAFEPPALDLPQLSTQQWKYINSLPELNASYDDTLWTSCNHTTTTNPQLGLSTPTSLYASDYGYHTGSLLYRGHFTLTGAESSLFVNISGGYSFGHSIWLNNTFLGSWVGSNSNITYAQAVAIPPNVATAGQPAVITILIDHMGQTEAGPGNSAIKFPIGILDYNLTGHAKSDIAWKITGNLSGEQYQDLARGPRNEGAMYAERNGFHLPAPPSDEWAVASPTAEGITQAGVGFYSTTFNLSLPDGYDIPLSFVFGNGSSIGNGQNYRVQLFVNGYQFGKYVNNLGPQTAYPVPEGILNYNGENWVALTLWALDSTGAKLDSLSLEAMMPVLSGYSKPALSPQPAWQQRLGAY